MITIQILGLDQFVVGHYSSDHTGNIASAYEVEENEINFYSPNSMVFHNGAEQTSWHTIVIVRAPKRFEKFEDAVAEYLLKTLCEFSVNLDVQFDYYDEDHRHTAFNSSYPRYITGEHIRDSSLDQDYLPGLGDEGLPEEEEDAEEEQPAPDLLNPEDVYLGNAFEGFEDALKEADEKRRK
ncbi:MAG: hypothetical protein K6F32_04985 [Bacilli bacterium]|nr:hypothetical protein [Bacilli bacterium]